MKALLGTALLLAPLTALHAQSDSPAQTFAVDQLNALRGRGRRREVEAVSGRPRPGEMDLAPGGAHAAEHVRVVPQDDHPRCFAEVGVWVDHGGQPLPADGEWQECAVGHRAERSTHA